MKGIILAGGTGTRLYPITRAVSKQLLPVYDKPMIYYPLSVLMLAGIRDILIISTPEDLPRFEQLLGDGAQLGLSFAYAVQPHPEGLAQAFLIGEEFIGGDTVCPGPGRQHLLRPRPARDPRARRSLTAGGHVFGYCVSDPERYGVVEFDRRRVLSIEEKPARPDRTTPSPGSTSTTTRCRHRPRAQALGPRRVEITDVNRAYLERGRLKVELSAAASPGSTRARTSRSCRPPTSSRRSKSGRA